MEEKRKPGRPKKADKRSIRLYTRVNEMELRKLQDANRSVRNLGTYIRVAALEKAKYDEKLIKILRKDTKND